MDQASLTTSQAMLKNKQKNSLISKYAPRNDSVGHKLVMPENRILANKSPNFNLN